jgi:CreA protein
MRKAAAAAILLAALGAAAPARADDEVGCVDTKWNMTVDDKICIQAFRDPRIDGVVCHVARAVKGGVKGALGLAEDTSDASIACRQIGPITVPEKLKDGESVFRESRSLWFKSLRVVRFYDKPNNSLVYLSYSDKLVDGSPKNSISTVPIMPWGR